VTWLSASAPGKIVVAGEYAVLDGAPAIAMAVNRRATARIMTPGDGATHSVTGPGHTASIGRFSDTGDRIAWVEGGADYGVVDAVWRELGASAGRGVRLELDTRAFSCPETGGKLGLGSSAAITVALAAAVAAFAAPGADVASVAQRAHRRLQGGAGSGVDVAVALAGGLLEYRVQDAAIRAREWPAGLEFAVFWSGVAASTTERLARLAEHPSRRSRRELVEAAERTARAWRGGACADVLAALAGYTGVLRRFSDEHDLGVFAAGHAGLVEAAPGDVVYKPCGAGGGDLGVAFAADSAALERFASLAVTRGFSRLPLSLEADGVLLEREIQ
jgi:phosphomevalonate kinase